jgi:hypothetical protein
MDFRLSGTWALLQSLNLAPIYPTLELVVVGLGCKMMYLNRQNFGFSLDFDLTGRGVGLQVPCSITYYRLQESSIDTEYYCCFVAGHCQVPKHAQGSHLWNQFRLWHMRLHDQLGDSAAWCSVSLGICAFCLLCSLPIISSPAFHTNITPEIFLTISLLTILSVENSIGQYLAFWLNSQA